VTQGELFVEARCPQPRRLACTECGSAVLWSAHWWLGNSYFPVCATCWGSTHARFVAMTAQPPSTGQ
jgi:hypothetical protein